MQAKLATDAVALNSKITLAGKCGIATSAFVVAEMSHDRWIKLASLTDTCLLSRRVMPAVRYFVQRGQERTCYDDLVSMMAELAQFSDVQLHVTLSVERKCTHYTCILLWSVEIVHPNTYIHIYIYIYIYIYSYNGCACVCLDLQNCYKSQQLEKSRT